MRLGGSLIGPLLRVLGKGVLGPQQERALRAALNSAADSVTRIFPELSNIGAEIELLGDDDVVRELFEASARSTQTTEWPASARRMEAQYGEIHPDLPMFMQSWAELLRVQLPWSEDLHTLWTASAVGEIQRKLDDEGHRAAVRQERSRRSEIIRRLHLEWLADHDGISPAMMAGTEPLAGDWVAKRLDELGEVWRQDRYVPAKGADLVESDL